MGIALETKNSVSTSNEYLVGSPVPLSWEYPVLSGGNRARDQLSDVAARVCTRPPASMRAGTVIFANRSTGTALPLHKVMS
jgi:hypothetical protein